ncbi:hypothetical protein QBC32DRAFT_401601 [Pseudoneurospora amorphoporcata]|uniref:Uncharacterized protein n=1 Tax=Pseudoneurospora amorphoporcata TaxID=241081 RepID=A0AAN6NKD1_9PEZI|nr:hypothetical protein QBC32DRAFT_401601 [Pseudoneurospora amorphoporcata]
MTDTTFPTNHPLSGPLSGKTALITGAGSGIGRSLAIAFARAGCFVACVSRSYSHPLGSVVGSDPLSDSQTQTVAELINAASFFSAYDASTDPPRARDFICDVTCPSSFAQLEKDIRKWVNQPVAVLVNNAGVARVEAIEFQRPYYEGMESWTKVIATNLTGPVSLTYQFLPGMLAAGDGCIISVGSRNAVVPVPFMAAYNVSKTGLLKFHETLEKEVGGRGVRNFFVVPGNIETGILKREHSVDEKSYQESERVRYMVELITDAGKKGDKPETRAEEFADVCVRLAAMGKDADILSGRYVDTERDVEALLEDAKKGSESEICKRRLYQLKVDRL